MERIVCSKEEELQSVRAFSACGKMSSAVRNDNMKNVNCELCGKDVPRTGSNQMYCPACARKLKMQRERGKQKTEKNTAGVKLPLNRLREAVPDKAPNGWSLRGKSADRITVEARALGLSYGQYTAACMGGNIILLLKSMGTRNGEKLINKAWEEHCRNQRGNREQPP